MRNLAFVIWLVAFPVSVQLADYLSALAHGAPLNRYSDAVEIEAGIVVCAIWALVGKLLYEPAAKAAGKKQQVAEE